MLFSVKYVKCVFIALQSLGTASNKLASFDQSDSIGSGHIDSIYSELNAFSSSSTNILYFVLGSVFQTYSLTGGTVLLLFFTCSPK